MSWTFAVLSWEFESHINPYAHSIHIFTEEKLRIIFFSIWSHLPLGQITLNNVFLTASNIGCYWFSLFRSLPSSFDIDAFGWVWSRSPIRWRWKSSFVGIEFGPVGEKEESWIRDAIKSSLFFILSLLGMFWIFTLHLTSRPCHANVWHYRCPKWSDSLERRKACKRIFLPFFCLRKKKREKVLKLSDHLCWEHQFYPWKKKMADDGWFW